MRSTKFRKKGKKQLGENLEKERRELSELYFDVRTGKEKDYAQINLRRRSIARISTVLNEEKKLKGSLAVKDSEKVKGKKIGGEDGVEKKKKLRRKIKSDKSNVRKKDERKK